MLTEYADVIRGGVTHPLADRSAETERRKPAERLTRGSTPRTRASRPLCVRGYDREMETDQQLDESDGAAQLREWMSRVILALIAYNRSASRARTLNHVVGGAAAIASTVVGAGVVTDFANQGSWQKWTVAALGLAAAVLASAHTFAGLSSRIAEYERAARQYGVLRRRLEIALLEWPQLGTRRADLLKGLAENLDEAADSTPNAPTRVWGRTRRQLKGEFTRAERAWGHIRGIAPQPIGAPADDLAVK